MTKGQDEFVSDMREALSQVPENSRTSEATATTDNSSNATTLDDEELRELEESLGMPKLGLEDENPYAPWKPNTPPGKPTCAVCGQAATLKCSKCAGAPTMDLSGCSDTWYCGKECQKLHYTRVYCHRATCNKLYERKLLVRAAELLQSVWRTIRLGLYERALLSAELHGDVFNVIEYNHAHEEPPWYLPFPNQRFEGLKDEFVDVLLYVDRHWESHTWLSGLLTKLLEGHTTEITILQFDARRWKYNVNVNSYPSMAPLRTWKTSVFNIKLKSREEWVVDMSGRVYGWQEPAMAMNAYVLKRAQRMPDRPTAAKVERYPIAAAEDYFALVASSKLEQHAIVTLYGLAEQHITVKYWYQWLDRYIGTTGKDQKNKLAQLLEGSHATYMASKERFVNAVEEQFLPSVQRCYRRGDMVDSRNKMRKYLAQLDGVDTDNKDALVKWEQDLYHTYRNYERVEDIRLFSCDLNVVLPESKLLD